MWALRKAVGDDALVASRTAVGLCPEAVKVDLADNRRRAAVGDALAAALLCRSELLSGYAEDWAETASGRTVLNCRRQGRASSAGRTFAVVRRVGAR